MADRKIEVSAHLESVLDTSFLDLLEENLLQQVLVVHWNCRPWLRFPSAAFGPGLHYLNTMVLSQPGCSD
jgi:hypothetical protein